LNTETALIVEIMQYFGKSIALCRELPDQGAEKVLVSLKAPLRVPAIEKKVATSLLCGNATMRDGVDDG
jgi:hypothetical protein